MLTFVGVSSYEHHVYDVSCYGDSNGVISLDQLNNSSSIYSYSINGVLISEVAYNSPAYKSGILPQDVIIEINSKTITDGSNLKNIIGKYLMKEEKS